MATTTFGDIVEITALGALGYGIAHATITLADALPFYLESVELLSAVSPWAVGISCLAFAIIDFLAKNLFNRILGPAVASEPSMILFRVSISLISTAAIVSSSMLMPNLAITCGFIAATVVAFALAKGILQVFNS